LAVPLWNKVNEMISALRRNPWGEGGWRLARREADSPHRRHFRLDPRVVGLQDSIHPHFGV